MKLPRAATAAAALAAAFALAAPLPAGAASPAPAPPAAPVTTMSAQELDDCVGFLERPGCGADGTDRGQLLTLAALVGGTAFVGWRISRAVRTRDAATGADAGPSGTSRRGAAGRAEPGDADADGPGPSAGG